MAVHVETQLIAGDQRVAFYRAIGDAVTPCYLSHLGTAIALSGLAWQAATAQTKYAEAQACETCHSGIAATYARTGMAQSFGTIVVRDPISKTNGTLFHHEACGEFFSTVVRRAATSAIWKLPICASRRRWSVMIDISPIVRQQLPRAQSHP